jgi:hypothetical protein
MEETTRQTKQRRHGMYIANTSSQAGSEAERHSLPSAADLEADFGLHASRDGACAVEVENGELRCTCAGCKRWKVRALLRCGV